MVMSRAPERAFSQASVACSRLQDGGERSISQKKCGKRGGGGAFSAPFSKSRASYFRFARFKNVPTILSGAWHRLRLVMSTITLLNTSYRAGEPSNRLELCDMYYVFYRLLSTTHHRKLVY